MSELAELHTEIRELRNVTEDGFRTMNGRVRKIELARAGEEAVRQAGNQRSDRRLTLQSGLGAAVVSTVLYVAAHVAHLI